MGTIHDIAPREIDGRSTVSRFRMQFQAAAFASLEILSGKEVDRVYCDYHDDFVVRRIVGGCVEYHFFQVKTKGRAYQQWSMGEVFALKKNGSFDSDEVLENIRNSMAGKLFLHTVEFGMQCREVSILSNVHFDDNVHEVVASLSTGLSSKKYIKQFIDNFGKIISPEQVIPLDEVEAARKKLTLHGGVNYIGETLEEFTIAAHHAIWKHSEIELHKHEVEEIANSLVALITKKSCAPINALSKSDIDAATGVGLSDLLQILSISTRVYQNLLDGGDQSAIKVASIIQRTLKEVGASESMIELASQAKVDWDGWMRSARHTFPDFNLDLLLDEVDKKCKLWLQSGGAFVDLEGIIDALLKSSIGTKFADLTIDLLFGAFCASIVRRATR